MKKIIKNLTRNETLSQEPSNEESPNPMMEGKRTNILMDDGTEKATLIFSEEEPIKGEMEDYAISTMMKLGIDVKSLPTMYINTAEGELAIKGKIEDFAEQRLKELSNKINVEPTNMEE